MNTGKSDLDFQPAAELSALPLPSAAAQQHSQRLVDLIDGEIQAAHGAISFARYMELVLYAPGLGYYVAGKRKLGDAGDFVTAPEISPLFSYCIANQCRQILTALADDDGGRVLEFGAGSGVMASEILSTLARLDCLPSEYLILDVSADLRALQLQTLQQRVPQLVDRVRWLERLPAAGFRGVIVANEVLDAMPVHRLHFSAQAIQEMAVRRDAGGRFSWHRMPAQEPRVQHIAGQLAKRYDLSVGTDYISEINLAARDWVQTLASCVEAGVLLLVDYGFPQHEYYHPQRHQGTLMCHYRHRAHDDPFVYPGLQDITTHVDFTAVAESAVAAGWALAGYTTQAHFLLASGLPERLQQLMTDDLSRQIELNNQVKKLTLPHEMGELFKVMALSKGLPLALSGFAQHDLRHRL